MDTPDRPSYDELFNKLFSKFGPMNTTQETGGKTVEIVRAADRSLTMREIDPAMIENVRGGITDNRFLILTCLDNEGMYELGRLLENQKELGAQKFTYELTHSDLWRVLEIKIDNFLACNGGAIFFDVKAKGNRNASVVLDTTSSRKVSVRIDRLIMAEWLASGSLSTAAEKHLKEAVLEYGEDWDDEMIDDELELMARLRGELLASGKDVLLNSSDPVCFSLELDEEGNTELTEMQAELLTRAIRYNLIVSLSN
jgi:hypothetical protein